MWAPFSLFLYARVRTSLLLPHKHVCSCWTAPSHLPHRFAYISDSTSSHVRIPSRRPVYDARLWHPISVVPYAASVLDAQSIYTDEQGCELVLLLVSYATTWSDPYVRPLSVHKMFLYFASRDADSVCLVPIFHPLPILEIVFTSYACCLAWSHMCTCPLFSAHKVFYTIIQVNRHVLVGPVYFPAPFMRETFVSLALANLCDPVRSPLPPICA